ncbi:hypothetical protein SRHO_G00306510 [Serrasalmus rhombeus]
MCCTVMLCSPLLCAPPKGPTKDFDMWALRLEDLQYTCKCLEVLNAPADSTNLPGLPLSQAITPHPLSAFPTEAVSFWNNIKECCGLLLTGRRGRGGRVELIKKTSGLEPEE